MRTIVPPLIAGGAARGEPSGRRALTAAAVLSLLLAAFVFRDERRLFRDDRHAPGPVSMASVTAPRPGELLGAPTLPLDRQPAPLPLRHVIIVMQENRSFDHYLGRLAEFGQPEADGIPSDYVNHDDEGRAVAPFHLPSTCLPADPPHQWPAVHAQWNNGRMDGFVRASRRPSEHDEDDADGRYALGYYDGRDLPFYYWLANTFALSDRHFSSALGGTWPNRQFLYTGTAQSTHAATGQLLGARTIFALMTEHAVSWNVFTDGPPRQDCIGWKAHAAGVLGIDELRRRLTEGALPAVSFVDARAEDEHPPADAQRGEAWFRTLYQEVVASPAWPTLALFFTYDEGGGLFDHVAPPAAVPPEPSKSEYDTLGVRVPFLLVSPWARGHHVSHVVTDHTSLLALIEALHGLPPLTARDAAAGSLLDLFDFGSPHLLTPQAPPLAGRGGCRPRALAGR